MTSRKNRPPAYLPTCLDGTGSAPDDVKAWLQNDFCNAIQESRRRKTGEGRQITKGQQRKTNRGKQIYQDNTGMENEAGHRRETYLATEGEAGYDAATFGARRFQLLSVLGGLNVIWMLLAVLEAPWVLLGRQLGLLCLCFCTCLPVWLWVQWPRGSVTSSTSKPSASFRIGVYQKKSFSKDFWTPRWAVWAVLCEAFWQDFEGKQKPPRSVWRGSWKVFTTVLITLWAAFFAACFWLPLIWILMDLRSLRSNTN